MLNRLRHRLQMTNITLRQFCLPKGLFVIVHSTYYLQLYMLQDQKVLTEWFKLEKEYAEEMYEQIKKRQITLKNHIMKFQYFTFGQKPINGYRLVFGLHGGGGCPTPVNDSQYKNHLHLYDDCIPSGTIWFVPRSCQQASDMWWKDYLPQFFQYIIRGFVLNYIVDPNRIFVTGYSAGGDGIYHLAPMMADYWAGAAMMAGHPNGVELYNVRNICFSIQVGGKDDAYNRNSLALQYIGKISNLKKQYGGFTPNYCKVFQECQHWMNKKDAGIFSSFLKQQRNPYPNCILFKQHPRIRKKYMYYIEVDPQNHKDLLIVRKQGNHFMIEGETVPVFVYVNHLMVNFSQDIVIIFNGQTILKRRPQNNQQIIRRSMRQRQDPYYIFEDCLVAIPNQLQKPFKVIPPAMVFKQKQQDCCFY